jgi:hypothetical protein
MKQSTDHRKPWLEHRIAGSRLARANARAAERRLIILLTPRTIKIVVSNNPLFPA